MSGIFALPGWQLCWQNSIYIGLSSWFAAKEIFNCIAFKCVAKGATFSWVEGEMGAYSSKKLLKKNNLAKTCIPLFWVLFFIHAVNMSAW